MASKPNHRLSPDAIASNREVLVVIQELPDYAPHNPAYSKVALVELGVVMEQAQQAELRAQHALAAARDAARVAEWALYQAVLGVKAQVIAQYGPNSDAVQMVGLKKKSERKRATRRKRETATVA